MARSEKSKISRKPSARAAAAAKDTPVVEEKTAIPVVAEKPAKEKKPARVWEPLPADRRAWVVDNARPAVAPCLCGCGGSTKGRFMPGHDATLKATLEANDDAELLAAFGW